MNPNVLNDFGTSAAIVQELTVLEAGIAAAAAAAAIKNFVQSANTQAAGGALPIGPGPETVVVTLPFTKTLGAAGPTGSKLIMFVSGNISGDTVSAFEYRLRIGGIGGPVFASGIMAVDQAGKATFAMEAEAAAIPAGIIVGGLVVTLNAAALQTLNVPASGIAIIAQEVRV